jgi:hypothetical protein
MAILTEPQKKIIALIADTPAVRDNFWLTGGTALAEFYLQHRYSEDMDFFTDKEENFNHYMRELQTRAQNEGIKLDRRQAGDMKTFFGAWAYVDGEKVKLDFAVDSPYRFKKPEFSKTYGIQFQDPVDLACGKVAALFGRAAPRDFVDVYFIHNELYNLDQLIPWAKDTDSGMDNYWLSVAFDKAKDVTPDDPLEFPRMIKSLDLAGMKKLFEAYKHRLMNEPFEARPYKE